MIYKCWNAIFHWKQTKQLIKCWNHGFQFLWSDESKFEILFGNHMRRILSAKEERRRLTCYQHTVRKPASMMVWGCISAHGMMANLHIHEGTINAERYRFWSNICCQVANAFCRDGLAYFSMMPNHISPALFHSKRDQVLNCPSHCGQVWPE